MPCARIPNLNVALHGDSGEVGRVHRADLGKGGGVHAYDGLHVLEPIGVVPNGDCSVPGCAEQIVLVLLER